MASPTAPTNLTKNMFRENFSPENPEQPEPAPTPEPEEKRKKKGQAGTIRHTIDKKQVAEELGIKTENRNKEEWIQETLDTFRKGAEEEEKKRKKPEK